MENDFVCEGNPAQEVERVLRGLRVAHVCIARQLQALLRDDCNRGKQPRVVRGWRGTRRQNTDGTTVAGARGGNGISGLPYGLGCRAVVGTLGTARVWRRAVRMNVAYVAPAAGSGPTYWWGQSWEKPVGVGQTNV